MTSLLLPIRYALLILDRFVARGKTVITHGEWCFVFVRRKGLFNVARFFFSRDGECAPSADDIDESR